MYSPPVFELTVVGVAEPNAGNRERIVFRPTQTTNLADFAVLVGYRADDGSIIPLPDRLFWFGSIIVSPPSWICLYSGHGSYSPTVFHASGETIHNFYWNRDRTMFPSDRYVPLLVRIGGVAIGPLLQPPTKGTLAPGK